MSLSPHKSQPTRSFYKCNSILFLPLFRSLHLDPRRKDPEAAIDKQLSHLKRGDHLLSVVTYCLHNVLADTLHPWKPLSACCDEKRRTSLLNPRRQTQILFDSYGGFPLKRRMRNTVHKIGYRDWCVVKLIHLVLSSPSDVTALNVCVCVGGQIGANVSTYSQLYIWKVQSGPKHVISDCLLLHLQISAILTFIVAHTNNHFSFPM
jgi:hypothetical protein